MQGILRIRLNRCSASAAVFLGFGPVSSKQLALKLYRSLKKEVSCPFFFPPGSTVLPHIVEAQGHKERTTRVVIFEMA